MDNELPPNILHSDNNMGPTCDKCGSDYPMRYYFFGIRNCINPECEDYERRIRT
jgi:hypothetical protein